MKIQICNGKMCKERFRKFIKKRLEEDIEKFDLKNVILEDCPCTGNCKNAPVVIFDWHLETRVSPIDASKKILDKKQWKKNKSK